MLDLRKSGDNVSDSDPSSAKLADYYRNPSYERRVVLFYDVLGWRNEIEMAGDNSERIGELRRLILLHGRMLNVPAGVEVNFSTFSDNIVVSFKPNLHSIPNFLRAIAVMQLATVSRGFLIRGGVTINNIFHDGETVFGPALNRAYELESTIAKFPRIVIDNEVIETPALIGDFYAFEKGIHFLDPFTTSFVDFVLNVQQQQLTSHLPGVGLPNESAGLKKIQADVMLKSILNTLKSRIRGPLEDKEWEKVAWLYDRIAGRLGVPPAGSYPRIRPRK